MKTKLRHYWRFLVKRPWKLSSFLVIFFFALFLPGVGEMERLQLVYKKPLVRASQWDNYIAAAYPKKIGQEPFPFVTAGAVEIIDLDSMVSMIDANSRERLWPASITKLMTALVALDYYQPSQVLSVNSLPKIVDKESEMGLMVGDKLSVQSLINGLLIPSGNDAAFVLADNYPGGVEQFVYAMNEKARDLHMDDTHFENPSGLDSPKHFSSARDIARLTAVALKNPIISGAVNTIAVNLRDESGKKKYPVKNVNQLLGYVYGVDGVKTGFTDFAGQCLVSSVSRNGHRVVIVLLRSQDRFGETARIIEWVFRNFEWQTPQVP